MSTKSKRFRQSDPSSSSQASLADAFARAVQASSKRGIHDDNDLEKAIRESIKEAQLAGILPREHQQTGTAIDDHSNKASHPRARESSSVTFNENSGEDEFGSKRKVLKSHRSTSSSSSASCPLSSSAAIKSNCNASSINVSSSPSSTKCEDSVMPPSVTAKAHAPKRTSKSLNAFTKLMSTHSEAKEWANADLVEARNYSGAARSRPNKRTPPFYKVLTGMPISVDAFRFGNIDGCEAYFLSHFHADHYGGLTSTWTNGPIYCSVTTANLVRTSLGVQSLHVVPLPMNETIVIPRTGGVRVTLLDANHCPGSCVFFFEGPQSKHILPATNGYKHPAIPPSTITFRYLHCGDFRASPKHANHPLIRGKRLDIIYLDTTYCNPRYCFPAQELVVKACADLIRRTAPEQCRQGKSDIENGLLEHEEDWRTPPSRLARLKAASNADQDCKQLQDSMRGWLTNAGNTTSIDKAFCSAAEQYDESADFAADDFRDEESAQVAREQAAEVRQHDEPFSADAADVEDVEFLADDADGMHARTLVEGRTSGKSMNDERNRTILACPSPERGRTCNHDQADDVKLEFPPVISAISSSVGKVTCPEASNAHGAMDFPRVLVVTGTYTIGKEKIVMACARALGTRVFCADPRKYRVYAQLDDPDLHMLLTRDPLKAYVHVTSLMSIGSDALQEHTSRMRSLGMRIDRAIAFRPTGWTYRPPAGMDNVSPSLTRLIEWNQRRTFTSAQFVPTRDSSSEYSIYGVPYSEHSSFFELSAFCLSVDYGRIIATVNVGNPTSRAKMARWFERWKAERKRRDFVEVQPRSEDFY